MLGIPDDVAVVILLLLAACGAFGWLLYWLQQREYKKSLGYTLDSLRKCVAQAETWVEQKPTSGEAKALYDRAKLMLDKLEEGLKNGRSPYLILRDIAGDVGVEMAIAARFKAIADKDL